VVIREYKEARLAGRPSSSGRTRGLSEDQEAVELALTAIEDFKKRDFPGGRRLAEGLEQGYPKRRR
jgi:hypothetical protein